MKTNIKSEYLVRNPLDLHVRNARVLYARHSSENNITREFKIKKRVLPNGANLISRLNDDEYLRVMKELSRDERVKFDSKKTVGWAIVDSTLGYINYQLHNQNLVRHSLEWELEDYFQKSLKPIVVLEWGCGEGNVINELAQKFDNLPISFYGFGDLIFREWLYAPSNVSFIFDRAEYLPRYFKLGGINFLFSYLGIQHLMPPYAQRHFSQLSRLLSNDAITISNGENVSWLGFEQALHLRGRVGWPY